MSENELLDYRDAFQTASKFTKGKNSKLVSLASVEKFFKLVYSGKKKSSIYVVVKTKLNFHHVPVRKRMIFYIFCVCC